jgi:AcrR family transcriptional regulator
MPTKSAAAPRDRLLEAANKLFYEEGIHTVGIDRIIEKAGVAKASLYSSFGSKDELIREYLLLRLSRRKERVEKAMAAATSPRARILAVFELLGEFFETPGFRGCAFLRASAEGPPHKRVKAVCADSRSWLRGLFLEQCRAAGAPEPEQLARQLTLLYDGATVAAQMDSDPSAAQVARAAAATLMDTLPA